MKMHTNYPRTLLVKAKLHTLIFAGFLVQPKDTYYKYKLKTREEDFKKTGDFKECTGRGIQQVEFFSESNQQSFWKKAKQLRLQ